MTTKKRRRHRPGQSVLSMRVEPELKAEVHRLAAESGVTVSDVIRQGIDLVLCVVAGGDNVAVPLNDFETEEEKIE